MSAPHQIDNQSLPGSPGRRALLALALLIGACASQASAPRRPIGTGGDGGDGGTAGSYTAPVDASVAGSGGAGGSPGGTSGHDGATVSVPPDAETPAPDMGTASEDMSVVQTPDVGGTGGITGADGGTVVNGIRHPGIISDEAELAKIRAIVNGSAAHPMKDGWNKMRGERYAQLTYQATPFAVVHVVGSGSNNEEVAIRNDGVAAYADALQWAILDDPKYSAKAIEIMNAWAKVLQDVVPATSADPTVQDKLEVSWYAPQWLNAAEIIRYHRGGSAGWSDADRMAFDANMVGLFKKKADAWEGSKSCCPNQGISVAFERMCIGVYTSDRTYFDAAVKFFAGTMLPRAIGPTGEILEINRVAGGDCAHATYNVEGAFDIAETAWHQGTDLYSNKLLPLGLEYFAQQLTTGAPTTSEGVVTCTTKPDSIEIAYNHYANRVGKPALPHTETLLGKLRPTDQGSGKFIPWDTLTHAELDK